MRQKLMLTLILAVAMLSNLVALGYNPLATLTVLAICSIFYYITWDEVEIDIVVAIHHILTAVITIQVWWIVIMPLAISSITCYYNIKAGNWTLNRNATKAILIMFVIIAGSSMTKGQNTKEDFDLWLLKTKYTQKSVDSINLANQNTPKFSPHRHLWDLYVNTRTPELLIEVKKHKAIRAEDEQHEIKLTRQLENLKKEVSEKDTLIKRLSDSLNILKKELKSEIRTSKPTKQLESGDVVIKYKSMFINATKNSIVTVTQFKCWETEMYRVNKTTFVFNRNEKANKKDCKTILEFADKYRKEILKPVWDEVEKYTNN